MIIEPIEAPYIDPSLPVEDQVIKLRASLSELVEKLNSIFTTIQDGESFQNELSGTPNQRAEGKAKRLTAAMSDIDMKGHRITGASAPKELKDVVTLEYLNSALKNRKGEVK